MHGSGDSSDQWAISANGRVLCEAKIAEEARESCHAEVAENRMTTFKLFQTMRIFGRKPLICFTKP
jgi:hypothetical protein